MGTTIEIKIGRYTYPATVVSVGADGVLQVKTTVPVPDIVLSMLDSKLADNQSGE